MKKPFLLIVLCISTVLNTFSQWTKINAIPTTDIVSLTNFNDTLYAASGTNLLFKSIDAGLNWNSITVTNSSVNITIVKVIDGKIYVGTNTHGIFISSDNGNSWQQTGAGLLTVSEIIKYNNAIYASTLGDGVFVYKPDMGSWQPFNDSLFLNISGSVFSIITTPSSLLVSAGANGYYNRYNTVTHQWEYETYYGTIKPGLLINKLVNHSDTIFAVNYNRIIRSNDDGINWVNDNVGTHNGIDRNMVLGANKLYCITNTFDGTFNNTWVQERDKYAPVGTSWALNEEFLANGYSYDILELNNKLFLAKADGLYVKNIMLSTVIFNFSATSNDCFVDLQWQTKNEQKNKGFMVERSSDGIHFIDVAFKESQANTNYYFTDNIGFTANRYYRLKQIDIDGKFTYSNTVFIGNHCDKETIRISPNPSSDKLTINTGLSIIKSVVM